MTETCLSGVAGGGGEVDSWVNEEGGAAGLSESREDWANSITVTSTLFLGEGDLDFGGNGDPPVDDPSGDGRSIDGEGDGEGLNDLGDVRTMELLLEDFGVSGLEAPGDIDVGLGDNKLMSGCTGEGGEETAEDTDAVDEDVEAGEAGEAVDI